MCIRDRIRTEDPHRAQVSLAPPGRPVRTRRFIFFSPLKLEQVVLLTGFIYYSLPQTPPKQIETRSMETPTHITRLLQG